MAKINFRSERRDHGGNHEGGEVRQQRAEHPQLSPYGHVEPTGGPKDPDAAHFATTAALGIRK